MADWRQIQARIRKAKNSADAPTKLSELYQRTRDAMVAWELALIEEKAERMAEAGKWYQIAAQRFRRADWKKKAEEALARLGIELPTTPVEEPASPAKRAGLVNERATEKAEFAEIGESQIPLALGEIPEHAEAHESVVSDASESDTESEADDTEAVEASAAESSTGHRASPRRQPRLRRRSGAEGVAVDADVVAVLQQRPGCPQNLLRRHWSRRFRGSDLHLKSRGLPSTRRFPFAAPRRWKCHPCRRSCRPSAPLTGAQAIPRWPRGWRISSPCCAAWSPARCIASKKRIWLLRGPAFSCFAPIPDSDPPPPPPSSYYVEACQTLRVGIGNLARGGRSGKPVSGRGYSTETGLKSKLAEHLGINEGKVSQYMKDHCVVRWIQLDDDAPLLAHFAIGVLRTPLNLD